MKNENCITIIVCSKPPAHVAEGCGIRAEADTSEAACREVARIYFDGMPEDVELTWLSGTIARAGIAPPSGRADFIVTAGWLIFAAAFGIILAAIFHGGAK